MSDQPNETGENEGDPEGCEACGQLTGTYPNCEECDGMNKLTVTSRCFGCEDRPFGALWAPDARPHTCQKRALTAEDVESIRAALTQPCQAALMPAAPVVCDPLLGAQQRKCCPDCQHGGPVQAINCDGCGTAGYYAPAAQGQDELELVREYEVRAMESNGIVAIWKGQAPGPLFAGAIVRVYRRRAEAGQQ